MGTVGEVGTAPGINPADIPQAPSAPQADDPFLEQWKAQNPGKTPPGTSTDRQDPPTTSKDPQPSNEPTASNIQGDQPKEDGATSLNPGIIAFIVIACVVVVGIAGFVLWKRAREQKGFNNPPPGVKKPKTSNAKAAAVVAGAAGAAGAGAAMAADEADTEKAETTRSSKRRGMVTKPDFFIPPPPSKSPPLEASNLSNANGMNEEVIQVDTPRDEANINISGTESMAAGAALAVGTGIAAVSGSGSSPTQSRSGSQSSRKSSKSSTGAIKSPGAKSNHSQHQHHFQSISQPYDGETSLHSHNGEMAVPSPVPFSAGHDNNEASDTPSQVDEFGFPIPRDTDSRPVSNRDSLVITAEEAAATLAIAPGMMEEPQLEHISESSVHLDSAAMFDADRHTFIESPASGENKVKEHEDDDDVPLGMTRASSAVSPTHKSVSNLIGEEVKRDTFVGVEEEYESDPENLLPDEPTHQDMTLERTRSMSVHSHSSSGSKKRERPESGILDDSAYVEYLSEALTQSKNSFRGIYTEQEQLQKKPRSIHSE